jgi:FkbM family methyltransferase
MDRYLDRKIVDGSVWESQSVRLIQGLVKPGMCVLDVGANFGYYTLQFARLVEPMGTVIAIEPTQEYASRLMWHLRENNAENVRLERVGFSDKVEEAGIAVGECSATLHWSADAIPRLRERIKLVPLDYWWNTYVAEGGSDKLDFLKVDVDGHELNFLLGAEQTLRRHRPHILIEFSQEALFAAGHYAWDLADWLESMGYILCSEENGEPFENRRALLMKAGNFAYSANVLAQPRQ